MSRALHWTLLAFALALIGVVLTGTAATVGRGGSSWNDRTSWSLDEGSCDVSPAREPPTGSHPSVVVLRAHGHPAGWSSRSSVAHGLTRFLHDYRAPWADLSADAQVDVDEEEERTGHGDESATDEDDASGPIWLPDMRVGLASGCAFLARHRLVSRRPSGPHAHVDVPPPRHA